jgi:hypothetical protein
LLLNFEMLVRLTKKFAERIDGIDLAPYRVGDTIRLPWRAAKILIAEGWAVLIERRRAPRGGADALGDLQMC